MVSAIENLKSTETPEAKLQSIAQDIERLLDQKLNSDQSQTENDFYLGIVANSFNKWCRKNNLSTEAEFEKRIPQLGFSKAKALGVMATRADTKKYPELLLLESNRLIKLADYAGKGRGVGSFLIENGIALEGTLNNKKNIRGFISEVDELLGRLEKRDYEINPITLKDNAVDGNVDVHHSSDAEQKKGKRQVQFSTLYKRATTSALTCFNRIIADGTLLESIEPDDLKAITAKLEQSFISYKHTVERRDQTKR